MRSSAQLKSERLGILRTRLLPYSNFQQGHNYAYSSGFSQAFHDLSLLYSLDHLLRIVSSHGVISNKSYYSCGIYIAILHHIVPSSTSDTKESTINHGHWAYSHSEATQRSQVTPLASYYKRRCQSLQNYSQRQGYGLP